MLFLYLTIRCNIFIVDYYDNIIIQLNMKKALRFLCAVLALQSYLHQLVAQ